LAVGADGHRRSADARSRSRRQGPSFVSSAGASPPRRLSVLEASRARSCRRRASRYRDELGTVRHVRPDLAGDAPTFVGGSGLIWNLGYSTHRGAGSCHRDVCASTVSQGGDDPDSCLRDIDACVSCHGPAKFRLNVGYNLGDMLRHAGCPLARSRLLGRDHGLCLSGGHACKWHIPSAASRGADDPQALRRVPPRSRSGSAPGIGRAQPRSCRSPAGAAV
jgi:hypothetical protein